MSTFKDKTIATTYDQLVKRADTYVQTGTNIELMTDSDGTIAPTGLYLEFGATTDNVAIGVAAPAARLHIVGTSATSLYINEEESQLEATDILIHLDFSNNANPDDDGYFIKAEDRTEVKFNLMSDGMMGTAAEVGVGTIDPQTMLHVKGAGEIVATIESTNDNASLRINANSVGEEANLSTIYFDSASDSGHEGSILYDHDNTADDQKMQFKVRDNGVTAMTIYGTGGVPLIGIGTASPAETLSVDGQCIFSSIASGADSVVSDGEAVEILSGTDSKYALRVRHHDDDNPRGIIIDFSNDAVCQVADLGILFQDGDDTNLYQLHGDGTITSAGAASHSDVRIKTNIVDATSKLADLNKLKVRNFHLKNKDGDAVGEKKIGFIADELMEVFPALVDEIDTKSNGIKLSDCKRIMDSALVPILVKAIQELSAKVTALENT